MTELQETPILTNDEEIEYKIEKATQTLDRNIGFINNCDSKTSIVLTALGVLLTIILTNDGLNAIFNIVRSCINEITFCNVLYLICFAITLVILFFGMYNLGSVLIARTSTNMKGDNLLNSRIFFSGIIKNGDFEMYKERFYAMNRQELLDELIAEIYINADIATKKYNKYNAGLRLSIIGFLLFILILLIGIYIYWGDSLWQIMIIKKVKKES